jgi:hypothetical protein
MTKCPWSRLFLLNINMCVKILVIHSLSNSVINRETIFVRRQWITVNRNFTSFYLTLTSIPKGLFTSISTTKWFCVRLSFADMHKNFLSPLKRISSFFVVRIITLYQSKYLMRTDKITRFLWYMSMLKTMILVSLWVDFYRCRPWCSQILVLAHSNESKFTSITRNAMCLSNLTEICNLVTSSSFTFVSSSYQKVKLTEFCVDLQLG